jgi:hypothetical protein
MEKVEAFDAAMPPYYNVISLILPHSLASIHSSGFAFIFLQTSLGIDKNLSKILLFHSSQIILLGLETKGQKCGAVCFGLCPSIHLSCQTAAIPKLTMCRRCK